MPQQAQPAFKAECADCEMSEESGDFDEVSLFVEKHEKHTDHDIQWVQADLELEVEPHGNWIVSCDVCDDDWEFEDEGRARDFRQEHAEFTDHEIENEPFQEAMGPPQVGEITNPNQLRSLIERLEEHYEEGVPVQAIYASVGDDETAIAGVKSKLDALRLKGEVYEPQHNRIRTV